MNPITLLVASAQGARLRSATEQLPPAGGPVAGLIPGPEGHLLRILVLGDSTAAGVGVSNHDEGMVGVLARKAAASTRADIAWRVIAAAGATSRRVRHVLLPHLESAQFDLAVVLVGVNDVLARREVAEWQANVSVILDDLARHSGEVVMTGIPPFERFPSMPRTLGRYLAKYGRRLDHVAQRLCSDRDRVIWLDSTGLLPDDPDFFARDGFHPSATGYALWADAIWKRASPGQAAEAKASA